MPIRWTTEAAKPPSAGEDVARSAGTGLIEGGASTFGVAGDVRQLIDAGQKWVTDKLGLKDVPPIRLPTLGPVETSRKIAVGALTHAGLDPRKARLVTAMMGAGGLNDAPSSLDVTGAVTHDKPLYQPQTKAGKYARTVASFAPAALTPGGPVRRAANVVLPGVASEAAGQATEGTPVEPYARVAAALATGAGVNLAGRGGPDTRMLSEMSRGATDEQIAAARALMERGGQQGVRLTMAEALQQVTNGATGMGRMQRVIEGTQGGSQRLAPIMAQRPQQVRNAVTSMADQIAPPTNQPSMIGASAQSAADDALSGVRQQINAQAAPHYKALEFQLLGDPIMAPLHQNPAYLEAARAVRANPVLGPGLEGLEDGSPAFVNEVVKYLDTLAENARPGPMNPGGNNQLSAAYSNAASQARQVMERHVPEWSQARQTVAQGRAANLEPLQRGPLGEIAGTADVGAQTRALFPNQPLEGAPAETATAIQMMGGSVSEPARGLVRQQLMNGFNEASQDLSTGPNQWGGAGWAAKQFGNAEQAATMRAGLEAVGGNAGDADALVEVLRATGKRQAPGSLTAYNARDIERLGEAGALGEVARTGLNPPGAFRRIGQGLQNWQTERNAGALADAIIANPADAERILLHARAVVPMGAELQAIERLALAAQLAHQPAREGQ